VVVVGGRGLRCAAVAAISGGGAVTSSGSSFVTMVGWGVVVLLGGGLAAAPAALLCPSWARGGYTLSFGRCRCHLTTVGCRGGGFGPSLSLCPSPLCVAVVVWLVCCCLVVAFCGLSRVCGLVGGGMVVVGLVLTYVVGSQVRPSWMVGEGVEV